MSCERVEELIRKLALGFIMLFLSGFLVIYYAIRKLACASTGLCSSAHWPEPPGISSVDMLVMIFVVSVVFFSVLWYFSSSGTEKSDRK
ncbi:hypothetical protein [Thermococcus thioreducens]|uniref:Uncharacterized protein n=1 Tax=Thermococcus thioreducens TaxID=277988 RepID=A0A0Q2QTS5_9EURY|nr:hypothetical protein [Thermococcus thioreducens]ASJ11393.1 hypothetical protein A3L14_00170 [Thermococcus thioreducens]KQH83413.1 hypothetical protein AMR53_00170 [Thermococcus thioreducens]SEW07462.1 hypothetical protein SAMN05216170_1405 [Thermococcus thioreducens]